uniref:Uncharacterized protein n=1 Tax=Branchiostoma floridae TaxID=7739 RepID=C3ZEY3_BRAFL|eukprot:XP_002593278.1 hypothetical protein BRAFLDRAFT_83823 [Branchiostoma floridae]
MAWGIDQDPTIPEEGRTGCCTTGGTKKEQEIWSYSSKPLGKALLRSVAADRQTCQHAVTMFTDILVYTARKSLRDVAGDTRLVEHIFRQAMKRDPVFFDDTPGIFRASREILSLTETSGLSAAAIAMIIA